jgi:hypothetical protein
MKNENNRKYGEYLFLAGHHLNPEPELTLTVTPDISTRNYLESIEVSLDEYEGVYNQDRLILLTKGDLKNGIELAKKQKEEIRKKNDDEKRSFRLSGKGGTLTFARTPYLLHPIVIRAIRGKKMEKGQQALYHISQYSAKGELVGGVSVIFQVGDKSQ